MKRSADTKEKFQAVLNEMLMLFSGHVVGSKSVPRSLCLHSTSPYTAAPAEICKHLRSEMLYAVDYSISTMGSNAAFQNTNEAYIIPLLTCTQIKQLREERIREKRWWEQKGRKIKDKSKEQRWQGGSWWRLVYYWSTSSSSATSSLQLFQFSTIICHLQFPLTFAPSFKPLFSVSHSSP